MNTLSSAENLGLEVGLLNAVIQGAEVGLAMADLVPTPTEASADIESAYTMTVIVSLMGSMRGTIYLGLTDEAAWKLSSSMLMEEKTSTDDDVMDCVGEIGNLITGGIKTALAGSDFELDQIGVPLVLMGQVCALYHSHGESRVNVAFRLPDVEGSGPEGASFSVGLTLISRPEA